MDALVTLLGSRRGCGVPITQDEFLSCPGVANENIAGLEERIGEEDTTKVVFAAASVFSFLGI